MQAAFESFVKANLSQKYLEWKYNVAGLCNVPYHPHLLLIEGIDYFNSNSATFDERFSNQEFGKLLLTASVPPTAEMIPFWHRYCISNQINDFKSYALGAYYNRCLENKHLIRRIIKHKNADEFFYVRDMIKLFSDWFKDNLNLFYSQFVSNSKVWDATSIRAFLLAEGQFFVR